MKGVIHLANAPHHLGKILLDSGGESLVFQVPAHFEEGDCVRVDFQHNDPFSRIQRLVYCADDWHYGFVQVAQRLPKDFGFQT